MNITALGYIGFVSPNHSVWKTWGPETLALGLAEDGKDGSVRLRMDDHHHRISIHPGPHDDLAYIGWQMRDRMTFERGLKELEEKKIPYHMATSEELANRCVANMAWLTDPYGYRHELYHGMQYIHASFTPGRPLTGFNLGKFGELGIGHCVLFVPEVTRAGMDFAADVLGFKTLWSNARTEFYRCNARTHCLVYVPSPGRRGPHHFYIDTNSMDDVGRAYDRCMAQGIVVWELGRLMPDDDVSFYLRSPAGVDVQYAHGGRMFKDEQEAEAWVAPSTVTDTRVWGHKVLIPGFGSAIRPVAQKAAAE